MKVPPALNLNPDITRVGLALPFSPEMFWRYPLTSPLSSLQQTHSFAPPSSPLNDVKNQMPNHLAVDPRMWTRDDVSSFLRWFEREFELPKIDSTKFCMNGKALCMLTKGDLVDRAPSAGDVLHNTLQFLLRDAPQVPPSPLTPHHPLLSPSPLAQAPNQTWPLVGSDFHNLGHLLQQGGSVTLSPAPSDQSGGSPRHPESNNVIIGSNYHHSSSASTGSTHSDSDESTRDSTSPQRSPIPPHSMATTFSAHALASLKQLTDYQRAAAAAAAAAAAVSQSQEESSNHLHHHITHTAPSQPPQHVIQPQQATPPVPGDEPVESGTNGRLLWDFLQQLLNDGQQRYIRYITWKNRDTGVFKIVDPPGLARLWGIQKNHLSMNYDKMSRALRYYYRVNILRKVQGERHCYQFLRNPSELKSIKNISLLRGAPIPARSRDPPTTTPVAPPIVPTPMEEEEGPTDLSMPAAHHEYSRATEPQNLSVERSNLIQDIKHETFEDEHFAQ